MELYPTASPATSEESPTQKQARIRRERREAKIKAGGSSRLDKITSLSGRPAESAQPTIIAPALSDHPSSPNPNSNPDPDEVDISEHRPSDAHTLYSSQQPRARDAAAIEGDIRHLLRGSGSNVQDGMFGSSTAGQPQRAGGPEGEEDPMMRMLQQMMGASGMPSREKGDGGLPPGLAAMLGGGTGGQAGLQPVEQKSKANAYRWKVLHALLALALGIYITSVTTFSGARFLPGGPGAGGVDEVGVKFFWAFATAELILQSSRFFLERGQVSQEGFVGFLMGILPKPWKGWVALASRYSGIYTTIVQDAMVVVFVLGCVAWWKGAAE